MNIVSDIQEPPVCACPSCDLLVEQIRLSPGEKGLCPRCSAPLRVPKKDSVNRTLALSTAGLLFYLPAMFTPLMTINVMGLADSGTIAEGILSLYDAGYLLVSLAVLMTAVLLPLAKHGILFILSLCLKLNIYSPHLKYWMRAYAHLEEWGMDQVYLIGVMVTIIKVSAMAEIKYEPGFFVFIGLVSCTVGLALTFDPDFYWEQIEKGAATARMQSD